MKKITLLIFTLAVFIFACDSNGNKDKIVVIHTEFGDLKVLLYEETPLHKKNFIELAESGKYDSTIWHRVINGFMVQGGDIYAKDGTSEPADNRIPAEIVPGFYHTKGALAAARQGDNINPQKKSSSCQFYIVHGRPIPIEQLTMDERKLNQGISQLLQDERFDTLRQRFIDLQNEGDYEGMKQLAMSNIDLVERELNINVKKDIDPKVAEMYSTEGGAPHLDNEYTVFGRVIEGLEIIDKIAAVETMRGDKPIKDIYMTMEVEKMSKKKITKEYGYEYPKN